MTLDTGKPLEIVLRVARTDEVEGYCKEISALKVRINQLETASREILVLHSQNMRFSEDLEEAYRRMRHAGVDVHGIPTFDAKMRRENENKSKRRLKNNDI